MQSHPFVTGSALGSASLVFHKTITSFLLSSKVDTVSALEGYIHGI